MIISNNKGVTLITLIIMIIVISILATTTIYYAGDTIEQTKNNTGIAKMQLIQEKVNVINQKIINKDSNYVDSDGNIIIGKNISDITDSETLQQINKALTSLNISQTNQYKYFDSSNTEQIELGEIEDKILIDFNTREIILVDGVKYNNNTYYSLEDISAMVYNVQYENKNTIIPNFSVITQYLANSCKIIIQDIEYSDYINSGEVSYKLQEDTDWIRINGTEFEVTKPGIYDIKLVDSAGNQATKKAYVYVFRDLLLCLDGSQNLRTGYSKTTDVWEDLSINNNDIKLNNFDGTESSGWQENYLYFDGVDDRANSLNVIDYHKTKKLTIQLVDLNGQLYNNDSLRGIVESSENYNYYYNSFNLVINEYGVKNFAFSTRNDVTDTVSQRYNYAYKNNTVKDMSIAYTILLNTTKTPEEFIDMYLNGQKQEELTRFYIADIEYIENYKLYIAGRNEEEIYTTMNLSNLRIYKTALTEEEININYQIDKARYNIQDNV